MCTPTCKIIATPSYFLWRHGAAGALWSALGREGCSVSLVTYTSGPWTPKGAQTIFLS